MYPANGILQLVASFYVQCYTHHQGLKHLMSHIDV